MTCYQISVGYLLWCSEALRCSQVFWKTTPALWALMGLGLLPLIEIENKLKSNQLYTYLYVLVFFYSKENSISGWLNGEREEVNSGRLRHWKTSIFMSSSNLWLHSAVSRLCCLFIIYFALRTIFRLVWGENANG